MTSLTEYFDKMTGFLPSLSQIKVTLFDEGFSNQVYRLDWHNAPRAVLRVPALNERAFYIDRQSELVVLSRAAKEGLSPKLLWQDQDGAFACQFVSQPSLGWDIQHDDKNIQRIAWALSRVHKLPKIQHPFCIYQLIEHYLKEIESFLPDRPELVEEIEYLSALLCQLDRVPLSDLSVVCHNDLNPKNVLMDDEVIWLIDWEYTGMGDPLFDLAVVARSHNLTIEQQKHLITSYDDTLDMENTVKSVAKYSLAYSLREMAWLLLKHLTTPNDPQALGYYTDFKAMPLLNPFIEKPQ